MPRTSSGSAPSPIPSDAGRRPSPGPPARPPGDGPHRRTTALLAVAVLALLASACGGGGDGGSGEAVTVRDSAGVRIVENRAPAWGEGEAWTVADTPSLTLGAAQGEGPEVFAGVQDALLLSDGGVAVLDSRAREIRIFESGGAHRATAGGAGEGPGEIRQAPRLVDLAGDTVGVWTLSGQRLTRFAPDGNFLDVTTVDGLPGEVGFRLRGALDDRRLVVSEGMSFSPEDTERGSGIRRDTLAEFLVGREGAVLDTLGRFAAGETAGGLQDGKRVLFARGTHFAVGAGRIHVGDSERWEVRVFDDLLRETMRIRRSHEPVPVTAEAEEAARREALERLEQMQPQFQEVLRDRVENAVANETLPSFEELAVDPAGRLWVRRARLPTADGPPRWDVFRPDGRWLGTVATPEGLTVHRIGADRLVGTRTDEVGVDRVEVYPIRRS